MATPDRTSVLKTSFGVATGLLSELQADKLMFLSARSGTMTSHLLGEGEELASE